MANKIAINYNAASFLMSSMKLGIPNAGTQSLSRKTIPALVWPVKETVEGVPIIGNVVFQNIGRDHTICVSFTKIGEPPTIIGNVVFVGVKKNHTIHVTFTHVIEPPEPISNHTKLLLLFNDNHTALRPEFYTGEQSFGNDLDELEVNTEFSPWFTPDVGIIESVTDFIKDSSLYDNVVCQLGDYGGSFEAESRLVGTETEEYNLGWINPSDRVEGRASFSKPDTSYGSYFSQCTFRTKYLPGCKLGVDDFTIDFWWKCPIETSCLHIPYWPSNLESSDVYGVYSFFEIIETNKYNYDGSINNELIGSYNWDTTVITYDPKNDVANSHAQMNYMLSGFLRVKDDTVDTVIDSGIASDTLIITFPIRLTDIPGFDLDCVIMWYNPYISYRKVSSVAGTWNEQKFLMDPQGVVSQYWTLTFINSTTFEIVGTVNGNMGTGNIISTCAPKDSKGYSYFVLVADMWGGSWVAGDKVEFELVKYYYNGAPSGDYGGYILEDKTKSWIPGELANKYVNIISGKGSIPIILDDVLDQLRQKVMIVSGPKCILWNTETILCIKTTITLNELQQPISDYANYFPETPDSTSHYEIIEKVPQYRLVLQHGGDVFDPVTHTGWFLNELSGQFYVPEGRKSSRTQYFYSGVLPYNTILDRAGLWNHIAFVRFKDNIKCYFNGVVLEEEFNIPFKFIEKKSENYMMRVDVRDFYGAMDVFRVNDIALWTKNFDPFDPIMLPNIYFDMELSLDSRLVGDDILLLLHMNGEDESTYFYDSSKYRHPVYNDSGYTKIINNVGVFDGVHTLTIDYFDINIDQTREFTIDFWIKFLSDADGKIFGGNIFTSSEQNFMKFSIPDSPGSALGNAFLGFGFCVHNGVPSIYIHYSKKFYNSDVYAYVITETAYIGISGVFCTANMVNVNKWVHFALVWHGLELKLYINGYHMGDTIQEPYLYNIRKALTIGTGVWGYEMDEIRISSRAEWTENFIPPTAPYVDPTLPSYHEVNPVFDLTSDMEIIARFPGEYDIEHNMIMDLVMQMDDIRMPPIEFNTNTSLNVYMNVVEKQYDFVFSNRWLKELLSTYPDVPGFSNYKIALMNSSFVFNRDTHEYFVDQLDEYEIVNQNGYVTGTSIVFKSFSEGGVLAFEDLTLPGASGGVYGPISALVVYDFDSHEKGLVVGCLTFDELIRVDQSTIKLSDLSFQIV